ncbi:MBL fold metallo-hydrolase [Actinomadura parmotrematis]|uniref:MBL fold metallo-hydrolase n=1 Tax=Actinomadura parmotrematis TaxID=2864039 RepID=A0ABS7FRT2_9ACTN|nr:MBL fold metallo-hydrolase [Actinomadura parmotrematis]MBW8483111.1 MBL fold metallo-hydrolase [Actinomadura parmotrematis]
MILSKHGHACVRIEDGGRALVIDPGTFSDPAALAGAGAVLVTHEHDDHLDVAALAAARAADPSLTVHAHPALAAGLARTLGGDVRAVAPGDVFGAAGFDVTAVGGEHAEIVDGLPGCPNIGFVVEGVYHPGDALFIPDAEVGTLLVPASGPWLKTGEAVLFLRDVSPDRAFPIHDAGLSGIGMDNIDGWLEEEAAVYTRIPDGGSVEF